MHLNLNIDLASDWFKNQKRLNDLKFTNCESSTFESKRKNIFVLEIKFIINSITQNSYKISDIFSNTDFTLGDEEMIQFIFNYRDNLVVFMTEYFNNYNWF